MAEKKSKAHEVLARKYRPQVFADVVAQQHVTETLANAIRSGRIAHAYLFVGPRGVGKTTLARIYAKALNCEKGPTPEPCGACDLCRAIAEGRCLDVLEFDAASNTMVDRVREIIIDNISFPPVQARYKLFIIDEVHMLSASSFNALLKTLEEPPAHVRFVFATTDPQKIPATILSRCHRFDLRRIPTPAIVATLDKIAKLEKIQLEGDAALAIARGAEGRVARRRVRARSVDRVLRQHDPRGRCALRVRPGRVDAGAGDGRRAAARRCGGAAAADCRTRRGGQGPAAPVGRISGILPRPARRRLHRPTGRRVGCGRDAAAHAARAGEIDGCRTPLAHRRSARRIAGPVAPRVVAAHVA